MKPHSLCYTYYIKVIGISFFKNPTFQQDIPVRGRSFNVKRIPPDVRETYLQRVCAELMPGSYVYTWQKEDKATKEKTRVGKLYVPQRITEVYPEFKQAEQNPGSDVRVEIGPFCLKIWIPIEKKKLKPDKVSVSVQQQLDQMQAHLLARENEQKQTQAMLDLVLTRISDVGMPSPGVRDKKIFSPKRETEKKQHVRRKKKRNEENEATHADIQEQRQKVERGLEAFANRPTPMQQQSAALKKIQEMLLSQVK